MAGRSDSKDKRGSSVSRGSKEANGKRSPSPSKGKESPEQRKERLERNRLNLAIEQFFTAVDEDGNGYLESHEFAVAQALIAGLADASTDEAKLAEISSQTQAFDENDDSRISKQEFENGMLRICSVLKARDNTIINEMAESAAYVVSYSRRELAREVRLFFTSMDADHSGYLDEAEVEEVVRHAHGLVDQQGEAAGETLHDMVEKVMSFGAMDKGQDGKVEIGEFVPAFTAFLRDIKVPKKDLVVKLRQLQRERSLGAPGEAQLDNPAPEAPAGEGAPDAPDSPPEAPAAEG
mmetsp:Transcript_69231/g.129229  ORF Transcript_69231/g.129229 Transcript_69231/m.129229 type:complete len:293 (+) Transcript_69231:75-953(+)